jgi:ABC-type nitrate/sulfonate/bicarbonate transport system substrate-binding protein
MKPKLTTTLFAALPLAGSLCLVPVASADRDYSRSSDSEDQVSTKDLGSFERYLDSHDETARALRQNPDLINDRRFVRDHDALNDWLDNHPDAAEAIRANPERYLSRETNSSSTDRQARAYMSEQDLRSFERYLDTHDETARILYQNPDLINDRQFVRDHDALQDWMENHPDAARALRADPDQYLWRQRSTSAADFLNQLLGSPR